MKCGSTSIQNILAQLEEKGQIKYFGFRPGPIDNWYKNEVEADFLNKQLLFSHENYFLDWFKKNHTAIEEMMIAERKDVWVSCENLSGSNIGLEHPVLEKLQRVKETMGSFDASHLVVRPLHELCLSWFWEINKRGYICSSEDYLLYMKLTKEDGLIFDLLPSYIIEGFKEIFPKCDLKIYLGVNRVIESIRHIYSENEQISQSNINLSSKLVSVETAKKNLWANKEKHRYLWSQRNKIHDEHFFSDLRKIKFTNSKVDESYISMEFREIFVDEVEREKKKLENMGLSNVANFVLDE